MAMRLSVITNTFNRRHVLERTLPSLLAQDLPPDNFEVVFVVDGSMDGTVELLRGWKTAFPVNVISQSNRGMEIARNVGLAAARGEILLFLDDDMVCTPGVLRQHLEAHRNAEPALVHGAIYIEPTSPHTLPRYSTEVYYQNYYRHLSTTGLQLPEDMYFISNSSLPRETLIACGGFDERAPGLGDLELGLRLWKMGIRFRYLPDAVAHELFVKSTHEFIDRQVKKWGRAHVYLCRKHPEFRPHSGLCSSAKTPAWKRALRRGIMRSPVSPVPLLTWPLRLAERLSRFLPIRKAGVRLLDATAKIKLLRTALREAGSWNAFQREFEVRLPVLLYHHIGPAPAGTLPGLTISPEHFERQMRWLVRRGYAGITASDWLRWLRDGTGLPAKPVLLTFDDAYADLDEYALPVLRRYGFSAVVYVVTEQLGGTNDWAGHGRGMLRLMTSEQIRYWATQGIEFGGHTRSHADLTKLGASDLAREVGGSADDLAGLLGSRTVSFAYPYGFYNEPVRSCVSGSFDLAFTTVEEVSTLRSDPFLLPRTMVHPSDTWMDLAFRVRLGWSPIQFLRSKLRPRTRIRQALARLRNPR